MPHKMSGLIVVAIVVTRCVVVFAGDAEPVPLQDFNSVFDALKTKKREPTGQDAARKKLRRPAKFVNGVGMTMLLIPAGDFQMGSPEGEADREVDETQHRVRITRPFYMGKCEVTQSQFAAVMGTQPWRGKKYGPWVFVKEGPNYAATHVSWDDASEFCRRLSQKEGRAYRLPTEAEWEYACRAGKTTAYQCGDGDAELDRYAWYDENTYDVGERYAHAVGQKKPNEWGLCDMHGNVWEWCCDWFSYDYYDTSPVDDPTGPASGKHRVAVAGEPAPIAVVRRLAAFSSLKHATISSVSEWFPICRSEQAASRHAYSRIGMRGQYPGQKNTRSTPKRADDPERRAGDGRERER